MNIPAFPSSADKVSAVFGTQTDFKVPVINSRYLLNVLGVTTLRLRAECLSCYTAAVLICAEPVTILEPAWLRL